MSRLDIDGLAQSLFLMLGDHERPSGLYTGVSPEEHAADIIDLETKLHLALSRTRMMKNALPAMNRMPQEVLAHVFLMLQIEPPTFPFFKADFYGWLRVVHVCRHWRITAFSHPHLWSQIHLRSASDPIALMSLNRSGQIPLRAYHSMSRCLPLLQPGASGSALKTVGEHTHRLQELHISGPWTLHTPLWTYLHSPAPNLEVLTIISGRNAVNRFQQLPLLFSDCTPKLRKLTLGYVSNWSANRFRNLTHLSLFDQGGVTQMALLQFLDFLRDSPSLEEMKLVRACPHLARPMLGEELAVLAPVSLTQLRYIEVGDWTDGENIVRFLSHLETPRHTTRCLWGHSLEELSLLANAFGDNSLNHIHRVVLMGHHNDRQMLGIKDGTLYVHGPIRPSQYESLFARSAIPNAVELILGSPTGSVPSTAELRRMIQATPAIETLTVTGEARFEVHRLLEALGLFDTNDSESSPGEVIAPNLHTLKIFLYKPGEREPGRLNVLPLSLLAEARAERGYPIDHLVIERAHGAFLESLEAYFETVDEVCRASRYADEYFEEELLNDIWRKINFGDDGNDDVNGWN